LPEVVVPAKAALLRREAVPIASIIERSDELRGEEQVVFIRSIERFLGFVLIDVPWEVIATVPLECLFG
jgi:hypothetical protein